MWINNFSLNKKNIVKIIASNGFTTSTTACKHRSIIVFSQTHCWEISKTFQHYPYDRSTLDLIWIHLTLSFTAWKLCVSQPPQQTPSLRSSNMITSNITNDTYGYILLLCSLLRSLQLLPVLSFKKACIFLKNYTLVKLRHLNFINYNLFTQFQDDNVISSWLYF